MQQHGSRHRRFGATSVVGLFCAVVLASCTHDSPPLTSPASPLRCGPRAITPDPTESDFAPVSGPTPAQLEALARQHRAPSPQSFAPGAALDFPQDGRALPQAALLWTHSQQGIDHLAVGEGLVVLSVYNLVIALDRRTGAERWRRTLARTERLVLPHVAVGCGMVTMVEPDVVRALDVADGAVRWEIPIHRRSDDGDFVPPSLDGCTLAAVASTDASPEAPIEIVIVDLRAGEITNRVACEEGCYVRLEADHALAWGLDSAPRVIPLDGSPAREVPSIPQSVFDRIFVTTNHQEVNAIDAQGAVLWTRPHARPYTHQQRIVAYASGSVVLLDPSGLTRVELATGAVEWRLPLTEELTSFLGAEGTAQDDDRLLLGVHGTPAVLEIDLATGAPRAFRSMAAPPEQLTLIDDVLIARSSDRVVAVDWSREAPPIRSQLSLEDDVERTLRVLTIPHPDHGDPYADTSWAFPTSADSAQEWLTRLAPMVPDIGARARSRMALLPLEEAVTLLPALGSRGASDTARLELLARSWGPPADARAMTRIEVARRLEGALPPPLANALACETIEWLELARAMPAEATADVERATRSGQLEAAIAAGRDLLERASSDGAPLAAVRDAIVRGRVPALRDCVPNEDDAVLEAAIRHSVELTGARYPVQAPGAPCVRVDTIEGPISIAPVVAERPFDRFELDTRTDLEAPPQHGDADRHRAWIGEGPFRFVRRSTIVAPLHAEWYLLVLRRVNDEWRVLATILLAIS